MTSKEALKRIETIMPLYKNVYAAYTNSIEAFHNDLAIVKKDLEVLEILKPMLEVRRGNTWFYLDTKHWLFDTQEQLDLVKEWLSNDK